MLDPAGHTLRPWHRFHVRTTVLYALPLFAILIAVAAYIYRSEVAGEHARLRTRLRALSVALASAIDPAAVALPGAGEPSSARRRMLAALTAVGRDQPDLVAVYVLVPGVGGHMTFVGDWDRRGLTTVWGEDYDASKVPLLLAAVDGPQVEHHVVSDEWGPTLSGYAPILDAEGRTAAVVGVDITAATIAARERQVIVRSAGVLVVAGLLLIVVGALVGRRVRAPIEAMVRATGAVADGRLDARVGLDRRDELGLLAAHFDRMAAGLQERERIRAMFGRYVSEDIARTVLASPEAAGLGGELREVSVLFSDLRGYSTIVEHLEPTEVIAIVNRYLDVMAGVIDQHGGCVLELLGDGILAVFGAPVRSDGHAAAAVACAETMHQRLAELNAEWDASGVAHAWQERGLATLGMRIGVHSGRVVAGNIGGATRMKYAVLGDAVNVAARLEQLNKQLGTRLVFSAAVRDRLPVDLATRVVERGDHAVKGRDQLVSVFTLGDGPAAA